MDEMKRISRLVLMRKTAHEVTLTSGERIIGITIAGEIYTYRYIVDTRMIQTVSTEIYLHQYHHI
jgi:hypothetical protein